MEAGWKLGIELSKKMIWNTFLQATLLPQIFYATHAKSYFAMEFFCVVIKPDPLSPNDNHRTRLWKIPLAVKPTIVI